MIDEQKLHHAFLRRDSLPGVSEYFHAFHGGRRAGRQRLGCFFHLHQAHAAIGRDRQFLVIAKMRNVYTQLVGAVHDSAILGYGYLVYRRFRN